MMPMRCIPCALTPRSAMPTGSAWAVTPAHPVLFKRRRWITRAISTSAAALQSSATWVPPTLPSGMEALGRHSARGWVGGGFRTAGGGGADKIAKWTGRSWSPLGLGIYSRVWALAVSGSNLYAGGQFATAGGNSANYIAKWNGSAWSALGSGMDDQV